MHNLNLIERLVIDSLLKTKKTTYQLMHDTSLSEIVLNNTIMSLLAKSFIKQELETFKVNQSGIQSIMDAINSETSLIAEREILTQSIIRNNKNDPSNFRVHKVFMTEKEETIFNGLIYNLNEFLSTLKSDQEELTKNEKIIIIAKENYENIINTLIN